MTLGERPPRSVRWAQAVVNAMDAVSGTFLLSMETIGAERTADRKDAPRLAVFRRATSRAAKGVKRSLIATVVIAIVAMVGVLAIRPTPHAPAVVNQTPPLARDAALTIAAVIRLKCARGAYRDLPEIQASACGKPSTPAKGEVR